MIAMAMVIPVAAIAAPTNKQEADFSPVSYTHLTLPTIA